MNVRIERDSLGEVQVPADKYWGAQTERSRQNFRIGTETMPLELIYAYAELKKAAAIVNHQAGKLSEAKQRAIVVACEEICKAAGMSIFRSSSGRPEAGRRRI
ncbi:Fumarate hydratase class II [Geobacillus sp. BCO2]|nr:Fumarate hydratase class II [Geobacillus sp. BCO2]